MSNDREFEYTKSDAAGFLTFFARELADPTNDKLHTPKARALAKFMRKLADPDITEVEIFIWVVTNFRMFPPDLRQEFFDALFIHCAADTARLCEEHGLNKKYWYFKALDALEGEG